MTTIVENNVDRLIGAKIHERRVARGMSRMDLAGRIGVTHQQLAKYENGKNRITVTRLLMIAAALQCCHTQLLPESVLETPEDESIQRIFLEITRNLRRIPSKNAHQAFNALAIAIAEYCNDNKGA